MFLSEASTLLTELFIKPRSLFVTWHTILKDKLQYSTVGDFYLIASSIGEVPILYNLTGKTVNKSSRGGEVSKASRGSVGNAHSSAPTLLSNV